MTQIPQTRVVYRYWVTIVQVGTGEKRPTFFRVYENSEVSLIHACQERYEGTWCILSIDSVHQGWEIVG